MLLARAEPRFLARLIQGFDAVAATLDRAVILLRTTLPEAAPTAVAARLRGSGADGFILYGEDHPDIAGAVDALAAAGRPVVSIVTDISRATRRLAYVGIDNLKAGRTAGFLAARLARRSGPVLITNSVDFRAHRDRIEGFRVGLTREAPEMPIAAVLKGRDEDDRAARLVRKALADHPGVVALYNTGGAVAAVGSVLRLRREPGGLVYIGHELSPGNTELLREGILTAAIDQAFELQVRRAVEVLLHHLGRLDAPSAPTEVPFALHVRENA